MSRHVRLSTGYCLLDKTQVLCCHSGESVAKASACRIVARNTICSLTKPLWIFGAASEIQSKFKRDEYERYLR